MKKALSILLSVCMLLGITAGLDFSAYAGEIPSSGQCGENAFYTYDSDSETLTICGSGKMYDYSNTEDSPFYSGHMKKIVIQEGITSIGAGSFASCTYLSSVNMPSSLTDIGRWAFGDCSGNRFKEISIPDGVNRIGDYAFNHCENLTSVTIGNGVKTIGKYAFSICKKLTEVIIPDSVTQIGSYAFESCIRLTNVSIGAGVNSIGYDAFGFCESISRITIKKSNAVYDSRDDCNAIIKTDSNTLIKGCNNTVIPSSVTSLYEYSFAYCKGLTGLIIPNSVKSIGERAFFGCTALNYIKLSNSMTSISEYTFYYCTGLTSISIPKSVTGIDVAAFYGCSKLKDVYYAGSENEWNKINISQYSNGSLKNANIHYYSNVGSTNVSVMQKGMQAFTVYNKDAIASGNIANLEKLTGEVHLKLKDVIVSYGGNTKYFDELTAIKTSAISERTVTFSKSAYKDYIIPPLVTGDENYTNEVMHNIFMQKSETGNKPYVSTVFVQQLDEKGNAESEYKEVQHDPVSITKDKKYNVVISANTKGASVVKYYLSQDNNRRIPSTNGIFSAEDFKKLDYNKKIFAYAVCDNVVTTPVELKLEKKQETGLDALMNKSTINIFGAEKSSFKLPKSTPLVGGSSITSDFLSIPFGVEVEGNRVRISLGFDIFGFEDEYVNNELKETKWKNFKNSWVLLDKALDKAEKKKNNKKEFDRFLKENGYYKKNTKKEDWNTDLFGYAEGYIVDGKPVFTESNISIATEFNYKNVNQTVVYGVPVYFYVEAGTEASFKGGISRVMPDSDIPLKLDATIGLEPKLTGGAGIGVESFVSGGLYAKATMPTSYAIAKRNLKLGFKGEAGFEGRFVVVKAKVPVLSGEVNLIDHTFGTSSKRSMGSYVFSEITDLDRNKNEAELSVVERDYIDNQKWVAPGETTLRRTKSRSVDVSSLTTQTLEESVNDNPQPQLVKFGDKLMMVWVDDDASRDTYNRYRLVYSVFDGNSWTAPKAVDDCGTNDYSPSVICINNEVYVAYQNINFAITEVDDNTVSDLMQNAEIKLAKYDETEDSFVGIKTVTSNQSYDYLPFVTEENGEATVYWASSNSAEFEAGSVSIMKSDFSGNVSTVASGKNYIQELAAIGSDVYYTMQSDASDDNNYDLNLFNNETQLTEYSGMDSTNIPTSLEVSKFNGEETLFYTDNKNLYYLISDLPVAAFENGENICGNLEVANAGGETTAIWCEATEYGTEFFVSSYHSGEWSQPVQLGEYGAMVSELSLAEYNNVLFGAFNKTERTQEDGEYINSQSDLCLLKTAGYTDVALSIADFDENNLETNIKNSFSVYVENKGTQDVESLTFDVSDSSGYYESIQKDIEIKPGESEIVQLEYIPSANTGVTFSVETVVSGDCDLSNNICSYEIGNTDISISDVSVQQVGENNFISAVVRNNSNIQADDVKIKIINKEYEVNSISVGTVAPKSVNTIAFNISGNDLAVDEETDTISVLFETTTSTSEINLGDNIAGISFSAPQKECEHVWEELETTEATQNLQGGKIYVCSVCGEHYLGDVIPYVSDPSALVEAISRAKSYSKSGFTTQTYQSLVETANSYVELSQTNAPQYEYDLAVSEILTAIEHLDSLSNYSVYNFIEKQAFLVNDNGGETTVSFEENINGYCEPLDVVKDGIINAKDFAYLIKNYSN